MEQYCSKLHRLLKKHIAVCNATGLSPLQTTECSFRAAVKSWAQLSARLRGFRFMSEENEMAFFKSLKPKLTSEIEYCTLVYHSLLFVPGERHRAIDFWKREVERLPRFIANNPVFIECCEDDQHQMRPFFFLREFYQPKNIADGRLYDDDAAVSTNADGLIAAWLALKKYSVYAGQELHHLRRANN